MDCLNMTSFGGAENMAEFPQDCQLCIISEIYCTHSCRTAAEPILWTHRSQKSENHPCGCPASMNTYTCKLQLLHLHFCNLMTPIVGRAALSGKVNVYPLWRRLNFSPICVFQESKWQGVPKTEPNLSLHSRSACHVMNRGPLVTNDQRIAWTFSLNDPEPLSTLWVFRLFYKADMAGD